MPLYRSRFLYFCSRNSIWPDNHFSLFQVICNTSWLDWYIHILKGTSQMLHRRCRLWHYDWQPISRNEDAFFAFHCSEDYCFSNDVSGLLQSTNVVNLFICFKDWCMWTITIGASIEQSVFIRLFKIVVRFVNSVFLFIQWAYRSFLSSVLGSSNREVVGFMDFNS